MKALQQFMQKMQVRGVALVHRKGKLVGQMPKPTPINDNKDEKSDKGEAEDNALAQQEEPD